MSVQAAVPGVGKQLPPLVGEDVAGHPRRLDAYRGQKLLVVLMTHPQARPHVVKWLSWAHQTQPNLPSLTLVSLRLPFFVGSDMVRRRVKSQVPQERWPHTWFERDGMMFESFGVSQSPLPWVFAVDEQGRIMASTQKPFSEQEAQRVFSAFVDARKSMQSPGRH